MFRTTHFLIRMDKLLTLSLLSQDYVSPPFFGCFSCKGCNITIVTTVPCWCSLQLPSQCCLLFKSDMQRPGAEVEHPMNGNFETNICVLGS